MKQSIFACSNWPFPLCEGPVQIFCPFLCWVACLFFPLGWKCSLYALDMHSLSDVILHAFPLLPTYPWWLFNATSYYFTCYLLLSSHWTSCFWNMTGPPPPQGSALTPPSTQNVLPQKSTQLPSSNLCFKVTLVRPPRSPYLVLEHLLPIPSPPFIPFYFLKKVCIIEIFKHIQNEKE